MDGKTIDDLWKEIEEANERENTRATLHDWEIDALQRNGVIWVGNRLIFSSKSKARIESALESGNYHELTHQEMAALRILSRQSERSHD